MIKLGIIGLGTRMAHLLSCFRAASPDLQLVGVVDPTPSAALERLPADQRVGVRFFDTLDDLLREARPDALAIGTRCDLHTPVAIAAARSGLPIFLEKPVATTFDHARDLERAFADVASVVVVSFPLRVSNLCDMVAAELAADAIGRPEHVLAVNYVPYGDVYFDTWYRSHAITGGLFLQKATHDFDYLAHLMGSPIVRVAAMAQRGRLHRDRTLEPSEGDATRTYRDDIGTPETGMNQDASTTLLEFASGAQGTYTQVFYSKHSAAARGATLSGLRGTLRFDWYRNALDVHHHDADRITTAHPPKGADHFGGDSALAENFIAVIRGESRSRSPLTAGIQSVYACLAARESSHTGQFVDVQPLTDLAHTLTEPANHATTAAHTTELTPAR